MKRLNLPKRCKIGQFTLVVDFYKDVNFDQVFGLFVRSKKDSQGKSSHPQDTNSITGAIQIILGIFARRGGGWSFARISENCMKFRNVCRNYLHQLDALYVLIDRETHIPSSGLSDGSRISEIRGANFEGGGNNLLFGQIFPKTA